MPEYQPFYFRTPTRCQNGHFRWYYYGVTFGRVMDTGWGKKPCSCPSHELSEGFAPIGTDQRFTGYMDRKGNSIYEGDIIQRYPKDKYKAFEVEWSLDQGFGLPTFEPPESSMVDFEVIGNTYEQGES